MPLRSRHYADLLCAVTTRLSVLRVVLLILLAAGNVVQAQESFPTTDAFVKANSANQDKLAAEARGDLNGDGVTDWVGVIRGQEADAAPTYQLFVLVGKRSGGYELSEKSQKAEIPGMGCCWMEDLQLRRGSIFVQNNAKTASVMEAATHQFKLHRGQWRLVGVTIFLTDHTPEAPKTVDTTMNLLTGAIIEKTKRGRSRTRTHRRSKKFATSLLKDYDFSNGFGSE